jgi:hypothetical protein
MNQPAPEDSRGDAPVEQAAWIEIRVLGRLSGRLPLLRVRVCPGGLVLHGRAPTYHVKQLAQHAAAEVSGLRILANEIVVT